MNVFLKQVFAFTFILLFFFGIAEIAMRLTGHKPGKIVYSQWNKEVERLSKRNGFIGDCNGIFRVDPIAIHWVDSVIQLHKNDLTYKDDRNIADSLVYEVYSLGYESLNVIHAKVSNPLSTLYQKIKNDNIENDLHQAIKNYVVHPVNRDGFRSIEFKQYRSAKKKVLLIGDSFTWGHSATDITNSFPDILLAKDYAVYNTGVSGGDVAQYTAIAEKYIPILQPDVVIVNFYLGNDVMYFDRKPEPSKPIFYATNAGNLISCPYTTYFGSDSEAYHFMLRMSYLSNDNIFKKFCSQTAIGTLLWMDLQKYSFAWDCPQEYKKYYQRELAREQKEPTANALMKRVEAICKENNSEFVLAIIPECKEGRLTKVSEYKNLFPQQNYFYPASLTIGDYRNDDGHFNDAGQNSYTKFLLPFIEKNN